MPEPKIEIEYVSIDELQSWPGNPKVHDIIGIQNSIADHGFNDPITVDESTGRIVEGHGRLKALAEMRDAGLDAPRNIADLEGEWYAPVIRGLAFDSEAEAEAYLLAHNKLVETGGWNDEMLSAMLEKQRNLGNNFETGFSEAEQKLYLSDDDDDSDAPDAFPTFDEDLEVDYKCPKCGYGWSGKPQ